MLTAINIKGESRKISIKDMSWSRYSSVVPFFLWKHVPERSWIICPRYGRKPFDVQIGITGTCWKEETHQEALVREVHEESGLVLTEKPNFIAETSRGRYPKKQNWLWAVCDAQRNCRAALGAQRKTGKTKLDNRACKVGILIYSTKKSTLESMISNAALRGGLYHLPDDKIIELVLVPTTLAKKISSYPPRDVKPVDAKTRSLVNLKSIEPSMIDKHSWPVKSQTFRKKLSRRRKSKSRTYYSKSKNATKKTAKNPRKRSSRRRKKSGSPKKT